MLAQHTVLCIQDGTDLNYNQLEQCVGLGILSKNQTGAKTRGLHLHSTFAVTGEGVPLGVLQAQLCVQQRLACLAGVSPAGVEIRSPVAWIAVRRETK
jgi:hypothetical protein